MSDRIKSRINKLLTLANNKGAAPNEAETALRHANSLMKKHAIEMGDLNDFRGIEFDIRYVHQSADGKTYKNKRSWVGVLALGVGYFCDARCMWIAMPDSRLCFKGEKSDVEYSASLIHYLIGCVEKESAHVEGDKSTKNSFRVTMASRLRQRMKDLRNQRTDEIHEEGHTNALVVVDKKISEVTKKFGSQGTSGRFSYKKADSDVHDKAIKAADAVNLSNQLTN